MTNATFPSRPLVLAPGGQTGGWILLPERRRDAWLASLRCRRLDARLAAGVAPESGRLLATRAAQLVRPPRRRAVASRWAALAATAASQHGGTGHDLVDQLDLLADSLAAAGPVGVRGVALAMTLLPAAEEAIGRLETGGADIAVAAARTARAAL